MKKVPTTNTSFDANEKLRNIQIEVNKFKSVKEKAQKEVEQLVLSLEDLSKRKKELEEIIALPYSDLAQFVNIAGRIVNESVLAMDASLEIAEGFSKLIGKMSERVETHKKELDAIEQKKREALNTISAEEARLSTVKEDLNIYRNRLQSKIDAFGLSDEIKIII